MTRRLECLENPVFLKFSLPLTMSSLVDNASGGAGGNSGLIWSEGEILAGTETKRILLRGELDPTLIDERALWLTVVNCKFNAEKAASKYRKWVNVMHDEFNLHVKDLHTGISPESDDVEAGWRELAPLFTAYAGCGRDSQDRAIMWIRTRPTQVAEETLAVRTGVIYWLAVHADIKSMREGITFVIDTEGNDMTDKIGNENKLQRVYQSIPLRPQRIFILGAGWLKRGLINALIYIASLFTSDKVIERIEFAELSAVQAVVSESSLPVCRGGQGGGIESNADLVAWVRARLDSFPPIPAY